MKKASNLISIGTTEKQKTKQRHINLDRGKEINANKWLTEIHNRKNRHSMVQSTCVDKMTFVRAQDFSTSSKRGDCFVHYCCNCSDSRRSFNQDHSRTQPKMNNVQWQKWKALADDNEMAHWFLGIFFSSFLNSWIGFRFFFEHLPNLFSCQ